MKQISIRVRAAVLALALGAGAPSFAVPVADMHAEELMAMAPDFRKSLSLNPNQQTLWQQVEGRSRAILRERAARRERLQRQAREIAERPGTELRDLGRALDAEDAAVLAEDGQLRELWLTMNDALDERQRALVAVFVSEQLQRVADAPVRHEAPKERSEGREGGHGRGGKPGMGGRQ